MKLSVNVTLVIGMLAAGFAAMPASASTIPCEDLLKDMRAAKATAKLSDADAKAVADLETKAVERCNADDDKRSDAFSLEALKIMGK